MRVFLFALAVLCPWLALASDSPVTIDNAVIPQPPAAATVSAAYMSVHNPGDQARQIVSAHSDVAEHVELHTHTHKDGMMQMRQVDEVALPAGETVRFEPGGLHIMLIGLSSPLEAGQDVAITLTLDNGESVTPTFTVQTR